MNSSSCIRREGGSRTRASLRNRHGFSLIEILVAVLVLSVGLLGMAALMATSLRNGQSANFRTQAVNLGYEMIDVIRADISNAGRYQSGGSYTTPSTVCASAETAITYAVTAANVYPPTTAPGTYDHRHAINRWASDLCNTLPNGRGRVTITPVTTGTGAAAYSIGYNIAVDVCWSDDRSQALDGVCDSTADGDTLITVSSAL